MYTILRQFLPYRKGFTLVETIVAVGIIVLMITVPLSVYVRSSRMIREEMNDLTALYLQQEAIEIMKMTIRSDRQNKDEDALSLYKESDVDKGYFFARCTGPCDPSEKLSDIKIGSDFIPVGGKHLYNCGRWNDKQNYCNAASKSITDFFADSFLHEQATDVNNKGYTYTLIKCGAPYRAYKEGCNPNNESTIFSRNVSIELQYTGIPYFCHKDFETGTENPPYKDESGNQFYDSVRLTSSATWKGRKEKLPELSTVMYRPFLEACE